MSLAAQEFLLFGEHQVGLDHHFHKLVERNSWLPAQLGAGLRGIAE